jgi:S-ribosylhomocysteine lyase
MLDVQELGWDPKTLGELDHQILKAPYVRLSSCTKGKHGDVVYFYDLRATQPNKDYMSTRLLHSFEHLLLAGFRKHMEKQFICVAPMGCQTGFYLILLNEGNAGTVHAVYETILKEILALEAVPYASVDCCGQADHHDLAASQQLASQLLEQKATWREIV